MSRYWDVDPQDIDPETNRPYSNYSSASLDTSFHDGEMDIHDDYCPNCGRSDAECGVNPCEAAIDDEEDDESNQFYSDDPRALQGMGLL